RTPDYGNKLLNIIMSDYWHTVTAIYLIWSFLTFKWEITWIIWPIAPFVERFINSFLTKKEEE
ncbi:MAG: hypothetical protein J6N76_06985, partial [Lachnospiraceae bacterium]|nr:hypothetical protein [Lachnospiraceae bacterium]